MINKEPGKLNYSTVGLGSTQHLIAEDLRAANRNEGAGGALQDHGEVVTALIRGDSAFAVDLYHAIRGQVDAGELRVLATATPKRWAAIPNVPAIAETIPGFGVLGWYGLAFPAGTPQPAIDKLRGALKEVLSREASRRSSRAWARSPICRRRKSSRGRSNPTSAASRRLPARQVCRRSEVCGLATTAAAVLKTAAF